MEITRASMVMVAIVTLIFAVFFPAAMAHSPAPAPAPASTSDGAAIDQGIACVLMLVALAVTYLVH